MKDYKSVSKDRVKEKIQKRLLLANIKELHSSFKLENPHLKIGLTKFVELWPAWCISVGSSGTHNVCVCIYHQNPKLMLAGIPIEEDYKTLMAKLVCSLDSEKYMLGQCSDCPDSTELIDYLYEYVDESEMIKYSEWKTTGRIYKVVTEEPASEFIPKLVDCLWVLCRHHYIAVQQSAFLQHFKNTLRDDECLLTADFGENMSFVVQDEVQGLHWDGSQCTIHPTVVYYR